MFSKLIKPLKLVKIPWVVGLIVLIAMSICIWLAGTALSFNNYHFLLEASHRLILICVLAVIWLVLFWRPKHSVSAANENNKKSALLPMSVVQAPTLQSNEKLILQYQALRKIEYEYRIRDLPGYLVLGATGSGKSTLLTQSGLSFPLQRQFSALSDPQQWWLGEQAVFAEINLDTTDETLQHWQATLELLKHYFNNTRWRGLIVCYSVSTLNDAHLIAAARLLRDCYQSFTNLFAREVPVYVLITQCDQLEGFNECFSTLDETSRKDFWGMFFPTQLTRDKPQTLLELFSENLTDLIQRLQNRLMHHLQPHPHYLLRQQVYQLPAQLEQLRTPVQGLLEQAFVVNRYQINHSLRGLFFCSSGIPQTQILRQNQGYFIQNLFTYLINDEKSLARITPKARSKHQIMRYAYITALSVCGLSASALWINSYYLNTHRLADFKEVLNHSIDRAHTASPLTQLLQAQRLTTLFPIDHPMTLGFGLYLNKPIGISAEQFYASVVEKNLIPGFKIALEKTLQQETGINLYKPLAVYLMLQEVSRRQVPFMSDWYATHWQQILSANHIESTAIDKLNLTSLLDTYFAVAKQSIAIHFELVEKARQQLKNLPTPKLIYLNYVLNQIQHPGLVFDDQSMFNFSRLFKKTDNQLQIPYIFTDKGFNKIMAPFINQSSLPVTIFDWVLGTKTYTTESTTTALKNYIVTWYWEDYFESWLSNIDNLHVIHFKNLPQVEAALTILTQPQSPLQTLLTWVQQNMTANQTQFTDDAVLNISRNKLTRLTDLLGNPKETTVNYTNIVNALAALKAQLQQINHAQNPGKSAFIIAKAAFQNEAGDLPVNQLLDLAKQAPAPVSQWLQSIANQSWQLILAQVKIYLDQEWRENVFNDYQNSIAGYYPFASQNNQSVDLFTFSKFFNQQSKLAEFIRNFIQPFTNNNTKNLSLTSLYGQRLPLSASALQQINIANRITASLFAQSNKPILTLIIRPQELDPNVLIQTLSNNQTNLIYQHGPEYNSQIRWPSQDLNQQSSLSLYLTNGRVLRLNASGPWALFKLFAQGKLTVHKDHSASLKFQLGTIRTAFTLTSDNPQGINVFTLLRQLKLPPTL